MHVASMVTIHRLVRRLLLKFFKLSEVNHDHVVVRATIATIVSIASLVKSVVISEVSSST